MKMEFQVSLFELSKILSEAMDLISPILYNHHKEVAYIACHIAKEYMPEKENFNNLLIAGLLHDIGGINLQERIKVLKFDIIEPYKHATVGYLLLREFHYFKDIAKIIKYHHLPWNNIRKKKLEESTIPIESHIIHLADRITSLINKDEEILGQVDYISRAIERQNKKMFHPELVETFNKIKHRESFWLDIVSPDLHYRLEELWVDCERHLDIKDLEKATKLIARIIDFRSRFTAVHSSGVAIVAENLARKSGWGEVDCLKIKIAGYLHDLGKLAISNDILDKDGRLTHNEYNIMKAHTYFSYHLLNKIESLKEINKYASLHHERLDGTGYPFRFNGDKLGEGSRIMAVADTFTAIAEDRPYRVGMDKNRVIKVLDKMVNENSLDSKYVDLLIDNYDLIDYKRVIAQKQARDIYKKFTKAIKNIDEYYCY